MDLCFSEDCNQGVYNARDGVGDTPLHRAAEENSVDLAKLLLAHSVDVDTTNEFDQTALHWAASQNSLDVAKVLIENSANVDNTDSWGETALHTAAAHDSVDVAKLLIENYANLNATAVSGSYKGLTPLQVAEIEGNQEMVELLRNA